MPQGQPLTVPDDGLTTKARRNAPLLAVHTGPGKGKSTAAFGMALRAWNQGFDVAVFQFVKSAKWKVGEESAFRELGKLHDEQGRVQIPGFYDDVVRLTDQERQNFAHLPFDEGAFCESIGIPAVHGEEGFTTLGGPNSTGSESSVAAAACSSAIAASADPPRARMVSASSWRAMMPACARGSPPPASAGTDRASALSNASSAWASAG